MSVKKSVGSILGPNSSTEKKLEHQRMSRASLATACMEEGIAVFDSDTPSTLRRRLGDHLVGKRLAQSTIESTPEPPAAKKRRTGPTPWNIFVKEERASILAAGIKGKDLIAELSRRWAAKKQNGAPPPMLMLTMSPEVQDVAHLVDGLSNMSPASIRAELALHGESVDGDREALVTRLALRMLSS